MANSVQDRNPNQRASFGIHESPTDLRRLALSKFLVYDVRNHVQSHYSNPTKQRVGPDWQKPTSVSHPNPLDEDIPFGEGRELIVDIEVDPRGMNDI